jgi:hypothetical protein
MIDDEFPRLIREAPKAQDPERLSAADHLVPDVSPLLGSDVLLEHRIRIGKLLLDTPHMSGTGLVFVVCLPSGGCCSARPPEWAVICERVGGTLTLAEAESPLIVGPAGVTRRTARLDRTIVQAVEQAWRHVLQGTRPPDRNSLEVGDTHVFGYVKRGEPMITGETQSQPSDRATGRLVRLSHMLREYIAGDDGARSAMGGRILEAARWFDAGA